MRSVDKPWQVLLDDNFHHGESSFIPYASYDTLEEAIAQCKVRVDECLMADFKPGIGAEELYDIYTTYGADPWIMGPPGSELVPFSAWDYAKGRCWAMCQGGGVQ